ncbi:MAG: TRAFs-binding domain-containing protein [Pseudomonadota bacterium]
MSEDARQICFVDMPFGQKTDPNTGEKIDFDQIYEMGIKPAILEANLMPVRGDQETTGGIIHKAMFARLMMAEFVVADMTTANPNVFYELGIRHTAKPQTTIPIFATIGAPPFDVNMVRAIPYDLEGGKIAPDAAATLVAGLSQRITDALERSVAADSPIFELFPGFPGIDLDDDISDVFRERISYSEKLRDQLRIARQITPEADAIAALRDIETSLGDARHLEAGVLIDLYLSYAKVRGYDEMIALHDKMPSVTRSTAVVRQQLALALNRRGGPGDSDKALEVLEALTEEQGPSAETLGIQGRIYKDRYNTAKAAKSPRAAGFLDLAIETYTQGFMAEPSEYYPGVNAITLLLEKGGEDAQIDYLMPLVKFAVDRQGGIDSKDYWTVATLLELAAAGGNAELARKCLTRAMVLPETYPWMFETTHDNLRMIAELRKDKPDAIALQTIVQDLASLAEKPEN